MPAANEEFREFLVRACHDLNTPLRSIRASAELLTQVPEKREGPDLEKLLGFILDGVKRMDSLVNGLAGYSLALQTHESSFQPTSMDVALRSALARLAKEVCGQNAQITHDALPRIAGDPDRLTQLFENLLRNAVLHRGREAPKIHVSSKTVDGAWLFGVRDNGPGLETEVLERIFRPFERLQPAGNSGPGLGLAICREIVTRHGGKIWAESEPGAGTKICFTLPAGA